MDQKLPPPNSTPTTQPSAAGVPVPPPGFPHFPPQGMPPLPYGMPPPPGFPQLPPGVSMPPPPMPPFAQPPPGFNPAMFPPPHHPQQPPMLHQPPPHLHHPIPHQQQPPPHMQHRPGLGAVGAPQNIPAPNAFLPPRPGMSPSQLNSSLSSTPTERFSLWIGSIADGIDDGWLEQILNTAGPLLSLKRIKDAQGKPKSFGFAEYGDLESVLRCLSVIHGASVPGIRTGTEKELAVKADAKTKERIAEYEKSRDASADTEKNERAKTALEEIISEMRKPDAKFAPSPIAATNGGIGLGTITIPLDKSASDMIPDDIPEANRGHITQEIAEFRERAAKIKSEAERKGLRSRGGGGGASGANGAASGSNALPTGSSRSKRGSAGADSNSGDRKGNDRPLNFVREDEDVEANDAADDEAEARRQERKRHDAEMAFKDRERRWENRERSRRNAVERERKAQITEQDEENRLRNRRREMLSKWDDDYEADRGKELFYVDRARWRNERKVEREREEAQDERDRVAELEDERAVQAKSDAFLNQQADILSRISSEGKRRTGVSLDDSTPIKLSFGAPKVKSNQDESNATMSTSVADGNGLLGSSESRALGAAKAGGVFGADEDDGPGRRKKIVPLSYSDDEDEGGDADEEEVERRKKKLEKIVESIPTDKESVWAYEIDWDQFDEAVIRAKVEPYVSKKIIEYLGMEEESLVAAVIDHVREQKSASALVDELELVLAEEAEDMTLKLYRFLIFESLARKAKLSTSMEI